MLYLHYEETDPLPLEEEVLTKWIENCCSNEGFDLSELNIICCSDDYLIEINKSYLQHDYYTDIITFDLSEEEGLIEGELYISIDRIRDNAEQISVPFDRELHRVIIHGVLHLLGYKDKSDEDQKIMRSKEDAYLSLLFN